jgi:diaminohydroxyphosphoribosylaminopyrimidine deaminase/5-amino-6-(5-phosphoribosylamino)uracil reductase
MEALARRGCNRVLWECGPALAAAAIRQGCVQELAAVVAPKLLGGIAARTPLADLGFERMDQVKFLEMSRSETLGADWLIQGRLLD